MDARGAHRMTAAMFADEVQGAIYPGVGTEGILVIIALVLWIGWHVLQNNAESLKTNGDSF